MITTIRTNSDNPDFQQLTQELDQELCKIYHTNPEDYEEYNRITGLGTVVLAYVSNKVVGCGCFRKFDDSTVELKRMYVDTAFRGKGIASLMVKELETWAIELGKQAIVLETGNRQPEAIALYHKLGYSDIENYSLDTAVHSISMRKDLLH